ncbi:GntR family transcriptional regulator [Microaceticoccus formicicus]|uniref:GntR family transcriptional regulator n=1 Tax=Microaceticoccus formicicus TaxID=3118105 RepID=UPI003CD0191B|nr:GntR family transcriptional regulator [Peptoniphilaceae bacterium AMB_02]
MKIVISNLSSVPIYEQIKNQVIEAILTDELKENDKLPSIRKLAKDLKISVITTTRAYKDLEEEGYVVNVQGKGCYVLPKNKSLNFENTMSKIEDLLFEIFELQGRISLTDEELLNVITTLKGGMHNE